MDCGRSSSAGLRETDANGIKVCNQMLVDQLIHIIFKCSGSLYEIISEDVSAFMVASDSDAVNGSNGSVYS